MIPKSLWQELGGFSEEYEKAYFEDTDLCFQVREKGYRVLYQPLSEVIHIEGLSSGTDLGEGVKKYQVSNQEIFVRKWSNVLKSHLPNATTPLLAADRQVKGHVLYIDAVTPEPDKDSGSLDAIYAMRIWQELGYRVHFVPSSNFAYFGQSTKNLQAMGIETIYHPHYSSLDVLLDERPDFFDFVVISRAESADRCLATIEQKYPDAKTVFNTVDLHFLRMERRAKRLNDADMKKQAQLMRKQELDYIQRTDSTIILSTVEREVLEKAGVPSAKLWTIPLIRDESERLVNFQGSQDIAFIGGFRHPPNVDAVEWLIDDIWPVVRQKKLGVNLHIVGSSMPDHFQNYAADDIIVHGFIPDLNAFLSGKRLTIAPLRYGAGLKGKVASSIGAGVPCIGTSVAFEGMAEEGLSEVKLQADTPTEFANLIASTYTNHQRWESISEAGVKYHNKNYAYKNVMRKYSEMVEFLGS
jgi:glycosyltransferase involved in cell wall biosynthesis